MTTTKSIPNIDFCDIRNAHDAILGNVFQNVINVHFVDLY